MKKHFDVFIGQLEYIDADSAGVVRWHGRLSLSQIQTLAGAFQTSSATCISITSTNICGLSRPRCVHASCSTVLPVTGSELGDSGAQLIANCLWHNDRVEKLCLAGKCGLRNYSR